MPEEARPGIWLAIAIVLAASACTNIYAPPVRDVQQESELISEAAVPSDVSTPLDVERWLTSVINRERGSAHLPLLRSDERVSRSARQRSSLAQDANSRSKQTLTQRLNAEAVFPVSSFEISLESDSITSITRDRTAFQASAKKADVTHVGVGVVIDAISHHAFVTVTYVQFPQYVDVSAATQRVILAINALEGSHANTALSQLAQQYAEGLAMGTRREDLWPEIRSGLDRISGRRFKKIANTVFATTDANHVDVQKLILDRDANDIGVGIAQSARYSPQGGITWIVIFLAQRPHGSGEH
jgi:hypothetical protein